MGRFTSIPSEASRASCSASSMPGSLSFSPSSLYFWPLVLKNRFSGRPLRLCQSPSSAAVGGLSLMWGVSREPPWASSHLRAFWQVVHLGYSMNSMAVPPWEIIVWVFFCERLRSCLNSKPTGWRPGAGSPAWTAGEVGTRKGDLQKGKTPKSRRNRRFGTPNWIRTSGLPLRRSPRVVAAVTHKPPQTLANTHFFQISFPTICHGFLLITAIF